MEGNPPDASNVGKTVEYLDACRNLFEKGILSHNKISSVEDSEVLNSMKDGYDFFVGWADYAWEQGINYQVNCSNFLCDRPRRQTYLLRFVQKNFICTGNVNVIGLIRNRLDNLSECIDHAKTLYYIF